METNVFKSKSFQSSIAGFIVILIVNFFPEFAKNQEQLNYVIAFVIAFLISGHKLKDMFVIGVNAWAKRSNLDDELYKLNPKVGAEAEAVLKKSLDN